MLHTGKNFITLLLCSTLLSQCVVPSFAQFKQITIPQKSGIEEIYKNIDDAIDKYNPAESTRIRNTHYNDVQPHSKIYNEAAYIRNDLLGKNFFLQNNKQPDISNYDIFLAEYTKLINQETEQAKKQNKNFHKQKVAAIEVDSFYYLKDTDEATVQNWQEKEISNLNEWLSKADKAVDKARKQQLNQASARYAQYTEDTNKLVFEFVKENIDRLFVLYNQDQYFASTVLLELSPYFIAMNYNGRDIFDEQQKQIVYSLALEQLNKPITKKTTDISKYIQAISIIGIIGKPNDGSFVAIQKTIRSAYQIESPFYAHLLLTGVSAFLASKKYYLIQEILSSANQDERFSSNSFSVTGLVDLIQTARGKYLGKASSLAQYTTDNDIMSNAFTDVALMLADEGSDESLAILKEYGVDTCLMMLNFPDTNYIPSCKGIKPFIAGALMSGKSGSQNYSGLIKPFAPGTYEMHQFGNLKITQKEADSRAKFIKDNLITFKNMLKETQLPADAFMAMNFMNEAFGDIGAEQEYWLDNNILKTYQDTIHPGILKKGAIFDDTSKSRKERNQTIYKYVRITGNLADLGLLVWGLAGIPKGIYSLGRGLYSTFTIARSGSALQRIVYVTKNMPHLTSVAIGKNLKAISGSIKSSMEPVVLGQLALYTSSAAPRMAMAAGEATVVAKALATAAYDSTSGAYSIDAAAAYMASAGQPGRVTKIINTKNALETSATTAQKNYSFLNKIKSYRSHLSEATREAFSSGKFDPDSAADGIEFANRIASAKGITAPYSLTPPWKKTLFDVWYRLKLALLLSPVAGQTAQTTTMELKGISAPIAIYAEAGQTAKSVYSITPIAQESAAAPTVANADAVTAAAEAVTATKFSPSLKSAAFPKNPINIVASIPLSELFPGTFKILTETLRFSNLLNPINIIENIGSVSPPKPDINSIPPIEALEPYIKDNSTGSATAAPQQASSSTYDISTELQNTSTISFEQAAQALAAGQATQAAMQQEQQLFDAKLSAVEGETYGQHGMTLQQMLTAIEQNGFEASKGITTALYNEYRNKLLEIAPNISIQLFDSLVEAITKTSALEKLAAKNFSNKAQIDAANTYRKSLMFFDVFYNHIKAAMTADKSAYFDIKKTSNFKDFARTGNTQEITNNIQVLNIKDFAKTTVTSLFATKSIISSLKSLIDSSSDKKALEIAQAILKVEAEAATARKTFGGEVKGCLIAANDVWENTASMSIERIGVSVEQNVTNTSKLIADWIHKKNTPSANNKESFDDTIKNLSAWIEEQLGITKAKPGHYVLTQNGETHVYNHDYTIRMRLGKHELSEDNPHLHIEYLENKQWRGIRNISYSFKATPAENKEILRTLNSLKESFSPSYGVTFEGNYQHLLAPLHDGSKVLYVLGGPNGSGKTNIYNRIFQGQNIPFLNPDILAKERNISPIDAAREIIPQIQSMIPSGKSFIIESTLSGRAYAQLIKKAKENNYRIVMLYIFVKNPQESMDRVRARVLQGGHDVDADMVDRYYKSRQNFWNLYKDLADDWVMFYNGDKQIKAIAQKSKNTDMQILDEDIFESTLLKPEDIPGK